MDIAHPDSAPWFMSLFHQFSLTIEYWRRLSDGKSSQIFQLQERLGPLEDENRELRSNLTKQSEAITGYQAAISALEYDLEFQKQSASAFCNAPPPAGSLLHRETHHQGNCYLSCSPSCLMLSEASSPNEIKDGGVCELEGGERTRKRQRTDDGE